MDTNNDILETQSHRFDETNPFLTILSLEQRENELRGRFRIPRMS